MVGAQQRRSQNERQTGKAGSSAGESSQSASAISSASASNTRGSATVGTAMDGNRDPTAPTAASAALGGDYVIPKGLKNSDMGAASYDMVQGHKVDLARRPPVASRLGREINIGLNTFAVNVPQTKVAQYQVLIGSGAEKRGLIMKAWESKAVQSQLPMPHAWIFDGNTLAWSTEVVDEIRVQVDLDAGRPPPPSGKSQRSNIHRVVIKKTTDVDFASLLLYLAGKTDWNNKCLETITFMDHLLREGPSKRFTSIKRSFFAMGQKRFDLGGGIEAFKGVYQSLRIAHSYTTQPTLTINIDVANGTFFTGGDLKSAVVKIAGLRNDAEIGLTIRSDQPQMIKRKFNDFKRLRKLHVYTLHRGNGQKDNYVIDRILPKSAADHKISVKGDNGQERMVSVQQYFMEKYKLRLANPAWPVVQMTKKAVLPIELCRLKENQRYPFKLDDRQTASMIKVAVTNPNERWRDIEHGLGMVDWANDPYLRHYKMNIAPNQTVVKARLLQNPKLLFGNKLTADPGTSGRWDLKGKKFYSSNAAPLKSWGFCVVAGRFPPAKADIDAFIAEFVKSYKNHGGIIASPQPFVAMGSSGDPGKCVEELWNGTGNKFQARPQILCFILPDKDSLVYGRIKRSCECRYGVVSQCMQAAHAIKKSPQYISNVCMKFNAKLGGVTNRAVGPDAKIANNIKGTVFIGADVSHAAPGAKQASMAAVTISTDANATRYAAACDTNGYRVEMINPRNVKNLMMPLLKNWVQTVGGGRFPENIVYVRDGVSEGQFSQVIHQEVNEIKKQLRTVRPDLHTKFIVIVASKRHHIRFFPRAGERSSDKNGNPLPGTLVETGVTHPFENDFYLCSHAAIKGTARPVHYNVLLNEAKWSNDLIHTLLYEHSYQYIRATTPVSLFPAVYYAHLASNRAVHHDKDFGNVVGGNSEEKKTLTEAQTTTSGDMAEAAPLMAMPDQAQITKSMWYV